MNVQASKRINNIDWIDALKAFALIGILLNHFVEEFGPGPWFTNPSSNWPDFTTRMHQLLPVGHSFWWSLINYFGWLGDSCPGVFILISGFSLTFSFFKKGWINFNFIDFYKKRVIRLYPLYITIHLLILLFIIFVPGNKIEVASINTFFSLIGLRFSDSLFFYINPSWWFMWLILQLYLVFPFLIMFLQKSGIKWFLLITILLTILSRLSGILGIHYNSDLYYWMTGSFFGTRLAEFSVGMALAYLYHRSSGEILNRYGKKRIMMIALSIYILGILMSFTLVGSILSNLFVSVGMSGIFYIIWVTIKRLNFRLVTKIILWIGVSSYAIFLIHQPFLKCFSHILHGNLRMVVSLAVLLCCFPAAYFVEKVTEYMIDKLRTIQYNKYLVWLLNFYCTALLFMWFFIEPKIYNELKYNLLSIFVIFSIVLVLLLVYRTKPKRASLLYPYWVGVILISTFQLFFLPEHVGFLSIIFIVPVYFIGFISFHFMNKILFGLITYIVGFVLALAILFAMIDTYLKFKCPIETNDRWGEYPALQVNPNQVYSLIPNKVTHLKYNNYDYILRTNSFGLPYPQLSITKPDSTSVRILVIGDAFTMPEGMEYKYSYSALLEGYLNRQTRNKRVEVINAGVTGYGPVEELAQMKELVPLFQPDIVLYEFFINEFEEVSLTPEMRLANIGLTSNMDAVKRYFKNSQVINYLTKYKNHITDWFRNNSDNWRYGKALLYFYKNGENPLYERSNLGLLERYLSSMKQLTDKQKAKFIICYVPGAVSVSKKSDMHYFPRNLDLRNNPQYDLSKPYKYLKSMTDSLHVNLLDLTGVLKSSPEQPVYFPDSWHWNQTGHKIVAKEIRNYLITNNFIKQSGK